MAIEPELKTSLKSERIACAVEPELREALQEYAHEMGVRESVAARYILSLFLKSRFKKTKSKSLNLKSEVETEMA